MPSGLDEGTASVNKDYEVRDYVGRIAGERSDGHGRASGLYKPTYGHMVDVGLIGHSPKQSVVFL